MDIKEVKQMGNNELITRFANLNYIKGSNDVLAKPMDEDLYMDIHLMKNEIIARISRVGVMFDTNNFI